MKNTGPLAGLKVVDLSHVMAGPVCTLMLADMGADVVKIERPPEGDASRDMAPPFVGTESAAFMMMNRHKRGIVLDLKTQGGADVLRRMIAGADIVVENYRANALDKMDLGHESCRAANPRLIWASISGFGRTGPYAERPGFDLIAQAMSGIMSFTGEAPGREPVKCGAPIADITAGILAALGICAALQHRERTGEGQFVETSLFEAAIMHTFWQSAMVFAGGGAPEPMGSAHPLDGPYQAFRAADGWFVLGAANQANWLRLLGGLDRPDLDADPRFGSNSARMTHLAELQTTLEPIFLKRPVSTWLKMLEAVGVPVAPVSSIAEMHRDPQAIARGMVAEVEHSTLGRQGTLGSPIKFSKAPTSLGRGSPILGEHTAEVLSEHGFSPSEIEDLQARGAIMLAQIRERAA